MLISPTHFHTPLEKSLNSYQIELIYFIFTCFCPKLKIGNKNEIEQKCIITFQDLQTDLMVEISWVLLFLKVQPSFNVTYDTDGWHTQTSKILREVTSVCFWLKGSWACQCICCSSRSSLLLLLFPLILSRWWTI